MVERIEQLLRGAPAEFAPERWFNFVVRRSSDSIVIGRIEATTYSTWAEVAYLFDPTQWGLGYATEATAWLVDRLHEVGCTEVWAAVHPDNERSVRLLARLGFAERELPTRDLGSFDEGDRVFLHINA